MTVTNSNKNWIRSSYYFIWLEGMHIENERGHLTDSVSLNSEHWSGMMVGTDGYPKRSERGNYFISGVGAMHEQFRAIAIEFYGVKTQI